MNAIDTNVFAYSVDADAEEKRAIALTLLQDLSPSETILPWQVVCELGAVLTKMAGSGRTVEEPSTMIRAVTNRFPIAMPSPELVARALAVRMAHQMSYWDGLLIAA